MPMTKSRRDRHNVLPVGSRPGGRTLGIGSPESVKIARLIQNGFSFDRLARLQKACALPWEQISQFVGIPLRTLTRRQSQGKLRADESDRVWRASRLFDLTVDLFKDDLAAARRWLQIPQPGLGGAIPLEFAATDVGAKEVENLIGRLKYGVFT